MSALLSPEPQGIADLIPGHLNSPAGMRGTIEPVEEPAMRGGEVGLIAAAGDGAGRRDRGATIVKARRNFVEAGRQSGVHDRHAGRGCSRVSQLILHTFDDHTFDDHTAKPGGEKR